jgi:hypothetical protein
MRCVLAAASETLGSAALRRDEPLGLACFHPILTARLAGVQTHGQYAIRSIGDIVREDVKKERST